MRKAYKIISLLIIILVIVFSFFKINTNIYIADFNFITAKTIDIQLKIDNKLVFDDILIINPSNFIIIKERLKYGFHKVNVFSQRASVEEEKKIFLFFNQCIIIEFLPADTLTYLHYQLPDPVFQEDGSWGVPEDSLCNSRKIPEKYDFPIIREKSVFSIRTLFNSFRYD